MEHKSPGNDRGTETPGTGLESDSWQTWVGDTAVDMGAQDSPLSVQLSEVLKRTVCICLSFV